MPEERYERRAQGSLCVAQHKPRIPLPDWPDGKVEGAVEELAKSAARGRELAALLDPEVPVPGVTQASLCPEIAAIAIPATVKGHNMAGDDFVVIACWGHYGYGNAVEHAYTAEERAAMGNALPTLGNTTFDIYLNGATSLPPSGTTASAVIRC